MSVVFPVTADPRFRLSTAVGGETSFSVPFPFQDLDDVAVVRIALDGSQVPLVRDVDYVLTGVAAGAWFSGGTVALAVPAVAGERFLRAGQAIIDRLTTIVRDGRFSSAAIDSDLDRWILIAQELARDIGQALRLPLGTPAPDLPAPVAEGFWRWNADGTEVEFVDILNAGDLAVSSYMQTLLGTANASALRSAMSVYSRSEVDAFLAAEKIAVPTTKTVAAGGDFSTIKDALDWALARRIVGSGRLTIAIGSGDWTLNSYVFDHPEAHRISIVGATRSGAVPNAASMTGTRLTDLNAVKAVMPTRITLVGAGTYGLALPFGLGALTDILIISQARYTITVGQFTASYSTVAGEGQIGINNCAIFDGVWGLLASHSHVVTGGRNLLAYNGLSGAGNQGGPMILVDATLFQLSAPFDGSIGIELYGTAFTGSGIIVYGGRIEAVNNLRCYGPMQVALVANDGADIRAPGCTFNGVQAIAFANPGAVIDVNSGTGTSCKLTGADTRPILYPPSLGAAGTMFACGLGACLNFCNFALSDCVGERLFHGALGQAVGVGVSITNCGWNTEAVRQQDGGFLRLSAALTSAKAGSNNSVTAADGGRITRAGSSGFGTFTPAANTGDTSGAFMG